jgi:inner membrane protein
MPSPIGHGLAGLAIGLALEPAEPEAARSTTTRLSRYAIIGAIVAALPDTDLLLEQFHRGATHSVGATAVLMIIAAAVTGWVTGRVQWRWVALVGAAHASHIVMDWMGVDPYAPPGLQALWPFSHQFYISGWDIFPPTERRLSMAGAFWINARAFVVEVGMLAPLAAAVFLARRSRRSRVPTSVRDSLQRPSA